MALRILHGQTVDVLAELVDAAALKRFLHRLGQRLEHLNRVQTPGAQTFLPRHILQRRILTLDLQRPCGLLRRRDSFFLLLLHRSVLKFVHVVFVHLLVLFGHLYVVHAYEEGGRRVLHGPFGRLGEVDDGLERVPRAGTASHAQRVTFHLHVEALEQHVAHGVLGEKVRVVPEVVPHLLVPRAEVFDRQSIELVAVLLGEGLVVQLLRSRVGLARGAHERVRPRVSHSLLGVELLLAPFGVHLGLEGFVGGCERCDLRLVGGGVFLGERLDLPLVLADLLLQRLDLVQALLLFVLVRLPLDATQGVRLDELRAGVVILVVGQLEVVPLAVVEPWHRVARREVTRIRDRATRSKSKENQKAQGLTRILTRAAGAKCVSAPNFHVAKPRAPERPARAPWVTTRTSPCFRGTT